METMTRISQPTSLMLSEQTYKECSGCKESFLKHNIHAFTSPHNGDAFISELEDKKPDIALLDVFMPGQDALAVKTNYDKRHNNSITIFLATGPFVNDNIIRELISNGFGYYFMKPFHPDTLGSQISILKGDEQKISKPFIGIYKATKMLHELGIPPSLVGFKYIRQAIGLVLENPTGYGNGMITRKLYPEIAERNHTTPSRVERGIRHAIEVSFNRCHPDIIEKYFGNIVGATRDKTTNTEFIMMLADEIYLTENYPKTIFSKMWV